MNEVLERLREQVRNIRRELSTLTVQLAEVTAKENAAEPNSVEKYQLSLERVRLEGRVWELRHLLFTAVVAKEREDAELGVGSRLRYYSNPSPEQLGLIHAEYEKDMQVARKKAKRVVRLALDLAEAKRYLKQEARRKRQRRREQEYGMEM